MATEFRCAFQVIDGNKKLVGDGLDVTSPMPGPCIRRLSPYLLINHIGPMQIAPTDTPLGSPPHPHRGFETVTVVYDYYLGPPRHGWPRRHHWPRRYAVNDRWRGPAPR